MNRRMLMKTIFIIGLTILIGLVLLGFQYAKTQAQVENAGKDKKYDKTKLNKATFAGGCFWCTESDLKPHLFAGILGNDGPH
jgi:hypothetical protein